MAQVLTTLPQQYAFPVTHHNKMEQTSLLSQWLIDSGCSTHMTPFVEDLVKDHESTSAAVEVANGNIIQATTIGTVSIRVVDIKTKKVYNIYLQGVLYVPGSSRRLFSVTQWTKSGGMISFHGEKCRFSYRNLENPSDRFSATTSCRGQMPKDLLPC